MPHTTTTTTYIVTLKSMMTSKESSTQFDNKHLAEKYVQNCCNTWNIDNWDGKEGGGVGYYIRITLEII